MRTGENKNFEKRLSSVFLDAAVGEGQDLQVGVDCQTLGEVDHALGAELVVVQLEHLNGWVHFGVQRPRNEFAAQSCDSIVQQLQEKRGLAQLEELANRADALVLAVGLPEADGNAVRVA